MLVELGGGTKPHPRASVVIDLHHPLNAPAQDATVTPWVMNLGTIADGKVDEVYSSHFLEHIPRGQPLIDVMNEAWRILKPGGTFFSTLPLVGYTSLDGLPQSSHIGWQPWADPTHVSYWWLPEALHYFTTEVAAADYGIQMWSPLKGFMPPDKAVELVQLQFDSAPPAQSWWSVRDHWEGIFCLAKPDLTES